MSDNIPPHEMQLEIIKKVSDVKCLLRLRSVSKQWMSFIDSREFIKCYGVRRHTQPLRLILRYKVSNINPWEFKYVSFIDDVTFPQQQQDFAPNVTNLMKKFDVLKVIGSSCGLWCFYSREYYPIQYFVIWNPAIRNSVGFRFSYSHKSPVDLDSTIGFGVCPKTYDPTIVVISSSRQVHIFTLSSMKLIPSSKVFRESVRLESSSQVAIDRFIYWIAYDGGDQRKNLILSFDLITHEFKEVDLPVSIANKVSLIISISELNESLVVSAYTNEVNEEKVYGVWMMGEEGGVMTSFTKLFNIKTPDYTFIRKLLGFRKNGEPIMEMETLKDEEDEEGEEAEELAALEVYEPCSENINSLGINGEFGSFFIFPYIETLLLYDQ